MDDAEATTGGTITINLQLAASLVVSSQTLYQISESVKGLAWNS